MRRPLTLRQIEAFKALVETGTVRRAADLLGISQPGVSKLLAHLEDDSGLALFSRTPGRLGVTELGMELYREIDRTYASVGQIERAVEMMRREEHARLSIGVLPALSGAFIADVVEEFRRLQPNVFLSILSRSSLVLSDWVLSRQVDLALLAPPFEHPFVETREILLTDLVCIMPEGHPLVSRGTVQAADMQTHPCIAFASGSATRMQIDGMLRAKGVELQVALEAANSTTICELVVRGAGIALVHPAVVPSGLPLLVSRPFELAVPAHFLLCRARDTRKKALVSEFVKTLERASSAAGSRAASP